MKRFTSLAAALALGAAMAGVAFAQPQRDPFNGAFGVFELPMSPTEAAREVELMGDALSDLPAQRPGVVDVYIVAAALWGDPVFEREASQAANILQQHFGDNTRTILLAAGLPNAPRTHPAASPNNLLAAIGKVGQVMDPSEDLMVLFITSHGSPDGSAAMLEHNRLRASLRPVHLRDALRAADIRNRVVIVSACFSGAFIAPLADQNTIVLTAAAPDRSSFGCQAENDWTFFGDAYFNNAVRNGDGLVSAFDSARVLVEQWEREQGMSPPSNPQRFVGANAAARLSAAEAAARNQ